MDKNNTDSHNLWDTAEFLLYDTPALLRDNENESGVRRGYNNNSIEIWEVKTDTINSGEELQFPSVGTTENNI